MGDWLLLGGRKEEQKGSINGAETVGEAVGSDCGGEPIWRGEGSETLSRVSAAWQNRQADGAEGGLGGQHELLGRKLGE